MGACAEERWRMGRVGECGDGGNRMLKQETRWHQSCLRWYMIMGIFRREAKGNWRDGKQSTLALYKRIDRTWNLTRLWPQVKWMCLRYNDFNLIKADLGTTASAVINQFLLIYSHMHSQIKAIIHNHNSIPLNLWCLDEWFKGWHAQI